MTIGRDILYEWTEGDAEKARTVVPVEIATLVRLLTPGLPEAMRQEFANKCVEYLAAEQLASLLPQLHGLIDEMDGAIDFAKNTGPSDMDAERSLAYVRNRLKTIVETHAQRTNDP